MPHSMASNKEDLKKGFLLKISLSRRGNFIISIANATTNVAYLKLTIHFGQCKSSRQKLAAKVVKTERN